MSDLEAAIGATMALGALAFGLSFAMVGIVRWFWDFLDPYR